MSRPEVNVAFFDTTLRDGAQSLPETNQFPRGSKVAIARDIAMLHCGVIEAGFPMTEGDGQEVAEVAKVVGNQEFYAVADWKNGKQQRIIGRKPVIAGLSRTKFEDIDATWEAVQYAEYPRIHTFVSTDKEHMAAKFPGKTPRQVMNMGRDAVRYAREVMSDRPNGSVEFSAEAASTTNEKYLERVVKSAIDEGADVINLPDTVGKRRPRWMYDFYYKAIGWVMESNPEVTISAHNHKDSDFATANTFALVEAAAKWAEEQDRSVNIQVETTICGVGERVGNTDVFPFAANLFQFSNELEVPITWQFNPVRSVATANRVLAFAGMEVDRQNPIVGRDAITHRSGIHSDGVIKGGYQLYTPTDLRFWGHDEAARHEEGIYQGKKGTAAARKDKNK